MTSGTRIRILVAAALVLAVVVAYWQIDESGAMATLLDGQALRQFIIGLGVAGPLAVIGLLTLVPLAAHYMRQRMRGDAADEEKGGFT